MPEKGLYERLVNNKWPSNAPVPTDQEALTGAKRLYKKAMGRPWRGKILIVRGNRHTWIKYSTFSVNPNRSNGYGGWKGIVHGISHYCHRRLHPGDRPHSNKQAMLERDLTDYVLEKGFLEGKLKSKALPKEKADPVPVRYNRMVSRRAAWEKKLARAENALQKVRREIRDYERRHGDRATGIAIPL